MEESRVFLKEFGQKSCPSSEEEVIQLRSSGCFVSENDLEGEITDWAMQYLHVNKCPHNLAVFLARETCNELMKDVGIADCCEDIKGAHEKGSVGNEDSRDIIKVFNSRKLLRIVHLKVHEVCQNWMNKKEMDFLEKCNHRVVSVTAIKNNRRRMEDRHLIISNLSLMGFSCEENLGFYAIFDGHAGAEAAVFASSYLLSNIASHPLFSSNMEEAIKEGFHKTETDFLEKPNKEGAKSGTTVLCAFINRNKITVAWVGDSQAVLVRNGTSPINLVIPHKPDRSDEKDRIENLGGNVVLFGTWRVNGIIAVSRAIGDVEFKPYIISDPEMKVFPLEGTEDFMILACDGLWDVLSSEDAANIIYRHLLNNPDDIEGVSQELVHTAVQKGSNDNITVLVVFLRNVKDIISTCPQICPVEEVSFSAGNLESVVEDSESFPNESYNFDIAKNIYNSKMSSQNASPGEIINKCEHGSPHSEHDSHQTALNGMNGENSHESEPLLKFEKEQSSQPNLWITSEESDLLHDTCEGTNTNIEPDASEGFEIKDNFSSLHTSSFQEQNVQEYFLVHQVETTKFDLEVDTQSKQELNPNSLLSSFDSKPFLSSEEMCVQSEEMCVVHTSSSGFIYRSPEVSENDAAEDKPSESTSPLSTGNEIESPVDIMSSDINSDSFHFNDSVDNLNVVKEMVQSESLSMEPITVEKIPETLPVADDVVDDESEDGDGWRYYHPSSIETEDKSVQLQLETKDNSSENSIILFEGNEQSSQINSSNDGKLIDVSKTSPCQKNILDDKSCSEIQVTSDILQINAISDKDLKDLSVIKAHLETNCENVTVEILPHDNEDPSKPETSTPKKNVNLVNEFKDDAELFQSTGEKMSVPESLCLANAIDIQVEPVSSVQVSSTKGISSNTVEDTVSKSSNKAASTSKNVKSSTSSTVKSSITKSLANASAVKTTSVTKTLLKKNQTSKSHAITEEKKTAVSSTRVFSSASKSTIANSKVSGTRPTVMHSAVPRQQDTKARVSYSGTLPKREVNTLPPNKTVRKPLETSASSKLKSNSNSEKSMNTLKKSSISEVASRPTVQRNLISLKMSAPTLNSSSKLTKDTLNKKISSTSKQFQGISSQSSKVDSSKPKTLTQERSDAKLLSSTLTRKTKPPDVKNKISKDQVKINSSDTAASGTIKKNPVRAASSTARKPKPHIGSSTLKGKEANVKILPPSSSNTTSSNTRIESKEEMNVALVCSEKGSLDESSKETVQPTQVSPTDLCSGDSDKMEKRDVAHLGEGDAGGDTIPSYPTVQ